jgi:integrase
MALAEYHKSGVNLDMSNKTLGEIYELFMEGVRKKNLSRGVMNTHNMAYNRLGQLKTKPIKEVKKAHLQDWLDGIDLKPGSKKQLRSSMVQVFDYAFSNDVVNKNYAKGLEIAEKVEKTGAIFTQDQIKTLWEHKENQTVQYILILIYTGLRISELLEITKPFIYLDNGYMVGGKKTKAGINRVIPIHNAIKPFIEASLKEGNYIINSNHGGAMSYSGIKAKFERTMERFGWNHTLHDTRKTAVSIMHSANIPMETIRIIVGHSGKGVTEQVYLDKEPWELVDAINTIQVPTDL